MNSDDSSEEEGDVQIENMVGAARQAQFTVRLLLDFLPNDILENFRWVPYSFCDVVKPRITGEPSRCFRDMEQICVLLNLSS